MFNTKEILFDLLKIDGISGFEDQVAKYMKEQFSKTTNDIWQDKLGNVVATYGSQNASAKKIMIFAHMDEVGFMVRKIEDDGFIKFERVGGPAKITMPGSTVTLNGKSGSVYGCIGIKSYHFANAAERVNTPAIEDLWIDIGANSKEQALSMGINVGTPISIKNDPILLANNLVCSKALDDRVGCAALLGIADAIAQQNLQHTVYLVASVQEEFNIRGILPVLNKINPDLSIGIDITPSCDTPDLKHYSDVYVNNGVGITCLNYHGRGTLAGLITKSTVIELLENLAIEHSINYKREVAPGVITETGYIQLEHDGIPCGSISIPCRYTHSSSEIASINDINNCIELLTALINKREINI